MALKRLITSVYLYSSRKEKERARVLVNILFFVGGRNDDFEVIFAWASMESSLVQILFVVANTKEWTFRIEERKWFHLNINWKWVSRS